FFDMFQRISRSTLFPYTTLFRSEEDYERIRLAFPMYEGKAEHKDPLSMMPPERVMPIRQALLSPWEEVPVAQAVGRICAAPSVSDRKSTRLNSSHVSISYAVFCL